MKIAIFGDSHANYYLKESINSDITYGKILSDKYQLTNFAVGGSSLFYSYKQIISNHINFDKIILFVTSAGRIYIDSTLCPDIDKSYLHITGYDMAIDYANRHKHLPNLNKLFQSVADYYVYVRNPDSEREFHHLMIEKIKSFRPDAIIIEVEKFGFQFDSDLGYYNVGNPAEHYNKYWDLRHCHFSQEKHVLIANLIENAIQTNSTSIDYTQLINAVPSKSFDEYFLSKNSPCPEIVTFLDHIK